MRKEGLKNAGRVSSSGIESGFAESSYSETFADLITMGSAGTFWCMPAFVVCTAAMASMTSRPFVTLPKDKYETWKVVTLSFYPSDMM